VDVLRVPFALHLRQWILGFSTDAEKDIRAQTRRFICDQIARAMEFIMMPTLSAKMPKAGKNILKAGQADVFCAHSYGIT
jgi:hypothetical protein